MRRAGVAAAQRVVAHAQARTRHDSLTALVHAGPGNNGGDGWVVADNLARAGWRVHVVESGEPRSADAIAARREALPHVVQGPSDADPLPAVVVDALLGTGAEGPLRGPVAAAAHAVSAARARGALVVALDLPTGVNATSGHIAVGAVRADVTVSFGTLKRAHLIARSQCGQVEVVDIGLGRHADLDDGAPRLVDESWVAPRVPSIAAESHKGSRRRLLVMGGDRGMVGAAVWAGRGALASGIGMVRLSLHEASIAPAQAALPEATAVQWFSGPPDELDVTWPHVSLLGPGLGIGARPLVTSWLEAFRGAVVLDADALNAFAGDETALADLLDGRPAIVTPHPLEFARLIGVDIETVLEERFEIGARLARALHATVLLKGVPTVVTAPHGEAVVSATGTPALGTGGSGDLLAGVAATLLAQGGDPFAAAACAAWVHGRAAEIASTGRPVRGVTLPDVAAAMAHAWRLDAPVWHEALAVLPRVGDA